MRDGNLHYCPRCGAEVGLEGQLCSRCRFSKKEAAFDEATVSVLVDKLRNGEASQIGDMEVSDADMAEVKRRLVGKIRETLGDVLKEKKVGRGRSVLQDWVHGLTFMQQSVLIAAVRGPDGVRKDHVAKLLLRWLRRCFLISAFDGRALANPWEGGGGSFTGPSVRNPWRDTGLPPENPLFAGVNTYEMTGLVKDYLRTVDELPHHFQLHFMHAAEILGYKHPDREIRRWWNATYLTLVNDMHLFPESEELMDRRLGDVEAQWREREEVVARGPSIVGQ